MWFYNGNIYDPDDLDPKDLYGFVYLIEHIKSNKKYIGKKFFWSRKTRQVKGKRKRYIAESDWRDYYGSSEKLNEAVDLYGKEEYNRSIIHLCKTKSECAYLEAYEQFTRNVLLSDEYYNDWISVRVTSRHVDKIREMIMEKIDDSC